MLTLSSLGKRFGSTTAVADLTLEVREGELLTLLGPSGCGKTTTLRMIAGFERPTSGSVRIDGRDVTSEPPQRRAVGMVFQNYALFPHLDVLENVSFGLKVRGVPGPESRRRAERALELVDLVGYGERKVQALSGGQQQRVALARALAPEPPVLLLDEPLSNLDPALRERTREELRRLLKDIGATSIFVTHDQEEAFALSDRIALMKDGRLQQLGAPEALYVSPANEFVAGFLGRANFLSATIESDAGEPDAAAGAEGPGRTILCRLPGGARWLARPQPDVDLRAGAEVRLMVRPEALMIEWFAGKPDDRETGLAAIVADRRFAGPVTQYRLVAGDVELLVVADEGAALPGDPVTVRPRGGRNGAYAFSAESP